MAASMGAAIPRMIVIGGEPEPLDEYSDIAPGLSPAVKNAIPQAVELVQQTIKELLLEEPLHAA